MEKKEIQYRRKVIHYLVVIGFILTSGSCIYKYSLHVFYQPIS